jgi:flagellar biosynthetic protein FlhB
MEINSVAVLSAGLGVLWVSGGYIYQQITGLMRHTFNSLDRLDMSPTAFTSLGSDLMEHFLFIVAPVWIAVFMISIFINLAQVGFLFAPKRIKPDLKKLNFVTGLKKFVSLRMLVDLGKNIGKLVVVGAAAYFTIREEWENLPLLGDMSLIETLLYIISVCFTIFWRCMLAMLILAILDWIYQKYDFEKNLKMSKQEVKDEYKQSEGDPAVKARIRSVQREMARKRMMEAVPEATVVITNPTHLAVAIKYEEGMPAPVVVAKGAGFVAQKIKAIAAENDVPLVENKPLARTMFKATEIGDLIPAELYRAVAEILAYVYRLKGLVGN